MKTTSILLFIHLSAAISVLLAEVVFTVAATGEENSSQPIPLHFLNILPFPDSRPDSGWDRVYELQPAAELAMDHINSAPNILPGYRLNIVTVPSEPCGISLITDGLVNSFAKVYERGTPLKVVGMGGLFCSTVTNALTGTFSSPNVKYLQLAASTTPVHRNSSEFPWLVHLVSSSSVFNSALLAIMRTFNWQKISLVYRSVGFFFKSDAIDFITRADEAGFEIVSTLSPGDHQDNSEIFKILTEAQARIIYITAPNSRCAIVMCEAYKNRAVYPGYVYIFHDKSVAGIAARASDTDCTEEELREAMEGVFFINYDLAADDDTKLISGRTYREYYQEYLARLRDIESSMQITTNNPPTVYSNVMYDQIWTFALALNYSLENIASQIIDLENMDLLDSSFIADTLRSEIGRVSFQGASGFVRFNADNDQETLVRVFQVFNGKEELVAEYHDEHNERAFMNSTLTLVRTIKPPPDEFETEILLLPMWVFSIATAAIGLIAIETTVTFFILYVKNRHRKEVKASSASLSVVMYLGCYFIYVGALMRNISRSFEIGSSGLFSMLCNFELWFGSIGMTMVFSALFMRLLRVRQIFKAYGRVSRFWNDKYLILSVVTICLGNMLLLLIWTAADSYMKITTVTYNPTSTPPHFESLSTCSCESWGTWLLLLLCYNGTLVGMVIVVAVQTRKIRLSNFKDTKKINIFIVATCTTLVALFPIWFVVDRALEEHIGGHFIFCYMIICTGFYCQLFLFLPLVAKVMMTKRSERKLSTMSSTTSLVYQSRRKERQYSRVYKEKDADNVFV